MQSSPDVATVSILQRGLLILLSVLFTISASLTGWGLLSLIEQRGRLERLSERLANVTVEDMPATLARHAERLIVQRTDLEQTARRLTRLEERRLATLVGEIARLQQRVADLEALLRDRPGAAPPP